MPTKRERNAAYQRKWYQANKEVQKVRTRANNKRLRKERKEFVDEHKLERGCCECGYKKCSRALDLHHRDPETKVMEIGRMITYHSSLEKLVAELAKCDVLCANCHRELHAGLV